MSLPRLQLSTDPGTARLSQTHEPHLSSLLQLTLNFTLSRNSLYFISHAALFHTPLALLILCPLPETLLATLLLRQLLRMSFKSQFSHSQLYPLLT